MSFTFGNQTATTTQGSSVFGTTGSTGFSFAGNTTTGGLGGGGFGGFGTAAATTTTSSLFGGFGTTTTASPFTFNTQTSTASTGFGGFGNTTSTGFGTGLGSTAGSGFGGFGTSTGTFGSTPATTLNTGVLGFNQNSNAQQEETNLANVAMAVSLPQIYGDERDTIIAKWNQLQAYWGTGKGFFSSKDAVEFKPDNHFCRFKALSYHLIPKGSSETGQVVLILGQKESQVTNAQQQVVDTLHKILGSKPTLSVCVEGIRPLPDDRTELVIYVLERPSTGPAKRIHSNELFGFLNQATQKNQLSTQLSVSNMYPNIGWTEAQMKEYLDKPPAGVDPLLWQQAKLDNPDPEKYIPVPVIGFKALEKRLQHQGEQTKLYQQRLDVISSDLSELQTQHSTMLSKLEDYKRKNLDLGHRLLKVLVKQEIYRKMNYAIQADEESLRVQLEQLQAELNHPTQFKGRLNELMSQMRMQLQLSSRGTEQSFQMDVDTQTEIKLMLKQQQDGLQHLIDIIKEDATDLQLIEKGFLKAPIR